MVMNRFSLAVLAAYLLAGSVAAAEQAEDLLRMASSNRANERVIAALALPDLLRVRGVVPMSSYYERLLSDPDASVVRETLLAIKRTPSIVRVDGKTEKTIGLLRRLRPRVEDLCNSSDKLTAQLAREARNSIRQIESEDKSQ